LKQLGATVFQHGVDVSEVNANRTKITDKELALVCETDNAIPALAKLTSLRELHIAETKITTAGVKRLTTLLPRCRIVD